MKLNLRKYEWLFILIAGILSILIGLIPMSIEFNKFGDRFFFWMFGLAIEIENHALDYIGFFSPSFSIVGGIFVIILLTIGIILVISAIFRKKNKNLKFQEYIWLIIGLFFLLMPFIFRSSVGLLAYIKATDFIVFYGLNFYSIELIMPFSAVLLLITGILNLPR